MRNIKLLARAFLVYALCLPALAPANAARPENVLVIINDNSPVSREIGLYYANKRNIPAKNVLHIKCPTEETIYHAQYPTLIEQPVKQYLAKTGLKNKVDYLVLTKGVPIGLKGDRSVDSLLMCMDFGLDSKKRKNPVPNPYYNKKEHFSHKKYGFYLATRLDGYTKKDAKALVDRALAAKPKREVFLFDITPARNTGGYRLFNDEMRRAHSDLLRRGYLSILEDTYDFVGRRNNLMGYCSWGSNDGGFDKVKYRGNVFLPGSIAETAVSSSARTFQPTEEGQSLIADLIKSGVTGVKGYVTEPTISAIANPSILFDRYVSGYDLAESFYMASRFIFWKDLVVGDPLTAPYAKR